jgi:hypothetical protein
MIGVTSMVQQNLQLMKCHSWRLRTHRVKLQELRSSLRVMPPESLDPGVGATCGMLAEVLFYGVRGKPSGANVTTAAKGGGRRPLSWWRWRLACGHQHDAMFQALHVLFTGLYEPISEVSARHPVASRFHSPSFHFLFDGSTLCSPVEKLYSSAVRQSTTATIDECSP